MASTGSAAEQEASHHHHHHEQQQQHHRHESSHGDTLTLDTDCCLEEVGVRRCSNGR